MRNKAGFLFILIVLFIHSCVYADEKVDLQNESMDYNYYMFQLYQSQANLYKSQIFEPESGVVINSSESTPYNPWHGSQFAFGAGGTTGDSNTSNAQINTLINYKPSEGEIGWNFNTIEQYNYIYSTNSTDNKNRLYIQQNGSYMFDTHNGVFAQVSYLNDANDGYFYVWNQNAGYQLQLFANKNNNLLFSFGPGVQERQVVVNSNVEIKPSWLTQITYNLNLNKIVSFSEQLQNVATTDNNSSYLITTLTLEVFNGFGINFNYQVTYNSQPEPGKAKLNTISGVNFVYAID
ncbi:DUF481 domain-containing protein [Aquella oligotrophica]|uniref:DUF481 domain-containing protein n=1 Tax=Aquella oligotrophica TaxID=2067065 RepID=A0A2I7N762_9NEIS|nr:DUF481 domain-containing protein [Aquella oligotrophica]AUR52292.1 hypothetical protein CUN60_08280 [Aquella oligotrophica]